MRRIESRQHEDELVAAKPRDGVGFAHRAAEPLGDRLQEQVPRVVAERVVDALEMVEVEEQARDLRAVALGARQDLPQPLVQERAVGQPGEDVVLRELVRVGGRDLEFARALSDLVLERALVRRDLRLRSREARGHVVERVGQEPEFVARADRHDHVEAPAGHGAGSAHEPPHGRHQPARRDERHQHRGAILGM